MANTSELLAQKKERLKMYYEREKYLLSPDAVQSYGVGTRNLQRYNTALSDIQNMIKKLEDEVAELEATVKGDRPRKAVGVVVCDW